MKKFIDPAPRPRASGRRIVRLTALTEADATPAAPPVARSGGAHRAARGHGFPTSRDDWLVLAERIVGDWAATLRSALLLAVTVVAALMLVGVVFGAGPALAIAFVVLLVFLAGRHRDGPVRR